MAHQSQSTDLKIIFLSKEGIASIEDKVSEGHLKCYRLFTFKPFEVQFVPRRILKHCKLGDGRLTEIGLGELVKRAQYRN